MRARSRIIGSLEDVYREAYDKAEKAGDQSRMAALDFGFQRDQVMLEVMLDLRDSLAAPRADDGASKESGLLDKAMAIRRFARMRPK